MKKALNEQRYSRNDVVQVAVVGNDGFPIMVGGGWGDSSFAIVRKDLGDSVEVQYVDEEAEITTLEKYIVRPADRLAVRMIQKNYSWMFESENKTGECMRKIAGKKGTEIQISEEFQIPGTDIILEAGDRIQVLMERETTFSWNNPHGNAERFRKELLNTLPPGIYDNYGERVVDFEDILSVSSEEAIIRVPMEYTRQMRKLFTNKGLDDFFEI